MTSADEQTVGVSVPESLRRAVRLVWAIVGLSGVTAAMTVLLRDDLVRTWAQGNVAAQAILAKGGIEALDKSTVQTPAFVPIAIVSFVVVLLGCWVLAALVLHGYDWARWTLATMLVFLAFASVMISIRDVPLAFIVVSVISLVCEAAALFFLFHKESTRYLRQS